MTNKIDQSGAPPLPLPAEIGMSVISTLAPALPPLSAPDTVKPTGRRGRPSKKITGAAQAAQVEPAAQAAQVEPAAQAAQVEPAAQAAQVIELIGAVSGTVPIALVIRRDELSEDARVAVGLINYEPEDLPPDTRVKIAMAYVLSELQAKNLGPADRRATNAAMRLVSVFGLIDAVMRQHVAPTEVSSE